MVCQASSSPSTVPRLAFSVYDNSSTIVRSSPHTSQGVCWLLACYQECPCPFSEEVAGGSLHHPIPRQVSGHSLKYSDMGGGRQPCAASSAESILWPAQCKDTHQTRQPSLK